MNDNEKLIHNIKLSDGYHCGDPYQDGYIAAIFSWEACFIIIRPGEFLKKIRIKGRVNIDGLDECSKVIIAWNRRLPDYLMGVFGNVICSFNPEKMQFTNEYVAIEKANRCNEKYPKGNWCHYYCTSCKRYHLTSHG